MEGEFEDGPRNEAQIFTTYYAEIEALNRRTALSTQVMADLKRHGAIWEMVMSKRARALDCLDALIDAPLDKVPFLQQEIMAFVRDCQWIHKMLEEGKEANAQLKEVTQDVD
jgi:hypothetical protein